jgi:DNA-binding CsgD family transcriptional regulator
MLEVLGLTPACAALYLSMLEFPGADAGYLAHRLDMDETEFRAALEDLERLALAYRSATDPAEVRLADPEIGLAALVARRRAEVARRRQEIEECRTDLLRLWSVHTERPTDSLGYGIDHLLGDGAVWSGLKALTASCTREACAFAASIDSSTPSPFDYRTLLGEVIDRGVHLRAVYLDSVRNDPTSSDHVRWLCDHGGEVRTAALLPVRMFLVDRRVAVVPTALDDGGATALCISDPGLVTALLALFDGVWRTSAPWGESRCRADERLSAQQQAVLALLCAGHTDEVIARRLGVSVRTTRRVVSGLLARLHARSRFQAGVLAAARSWIDLANLPDP